MRENVEVDFTHNPREIEQGLVSLIFPPFHEANLFDAVVDVAGRLQDVKGKKAILVLASGMDTFSKLTLDKTLSRLKETDVTIYCVGVAEELFVRTRFGRRTYLPASSESAPYLRRNDRRPQLVPALRRRNSGDYGRRGRQPAK